MLITNMGVYNLKDTSNYMVYSAIKRKINIEKVKAITVSKIGT